MISLPSAHTWPLLFGVFVLGACGGAGDTGGPNGGNSGVDLDSDGYSPPGDCDDEDPSVHPGAADICNEVDDDCDGSTDEDPDLAWYRDTDGDGFGRDDSPLFSCEQQAGYSPFGSDCDDGDPDIFPGAQEFCDGVDQNCDGTADELATRVDSGKNGSARDGKGDGSPDSPFGSIQEAIDAATWCVVVGEGTYYEAIDFGGKGIIVRAEAGPESTVIDASHDRRSVVTFASGESADAVLEGFTITGGEADDGAGIMIDNASPVLRNLFIEGNTADEYGGGVYAGAGYAVLEDLAISGNTASYGGGVAIASPDGVVLVDSDISGNDATYGGGVVVVDGGQSNLSGLGIVGNDATNGGGLAVLFSSQATLEDSVLERNYATAGGGVMALYDSGISVFGTEILENQASAYGGGVCMWSESWMWLEAVSIQGNIAPQGAAGNVYYYSSLGASALSVLNNGGREDSGFWVGTQASLTLANAVFDGNYYVDLGDYFGIARGGGKYLGSTSNISGAVTASYDSSVWLTNVTVADCEGMAAIYLEAYSMLDMLNSIVAYNSGHGIFYADSTSISAWLDYSDFWSNSLGDFGGYYDLAYDGEGLLFREPEFQDLSLDLDGTNDDLHLSSTSPLLDAGSPDDSYYDVDGSRNDMGAYGGSGGDW